MKEVRPPPFPGRCPPCSPHTPPQIPCLYYECSWTVGSWAAQWPSWSPPLPVICLLMLLESVMCCSIAPERTPAMPSRIKYYIRQNYLFTNFICTFLLGRGRNQSSGWCKNLNKMKVPSGWCSPKEMPTHFLKRVNIYNILTWLVIIGKKN